LFSELDAGRREFEAVMHQIGVGGGSSSSAAAAAAAGHAQVPEAFLRPTPQPTPEPVPLKHQLDCPHGHLLEFWKPATARDMRYRTPYADSGLREKYVTFEPDVGGWNNVRMQMETVLVFAAATGRTLVLPPDQPMYLLDKGKGHQKAHSFADFFPFDLIKQRVPVIEMTAFMAKVRLLLHNEGRCRFFTTTVLVARRASRAASSARSPARCSCPRGTRPSSSGRRVTTAWRCGGTCATSPSRPA
jgi:hypothetical protein